jgi:hypothetical protein
MHSQSPVTAKVLSVMMLNDHRRQTFLNVDFGG